MSKKIINLLFLLPLIWFSCEKELNITDFKDDFGNYEPELKIEGILQQDNPQKSIIRIIRSSAITDIDVFDGKDNDGDGEIDEYDEVLPLIQDTSAIVKIINLQTNEEFEFEFVASADSFVHWTDEENYAETNQSMVPYSGYKPKDENFSLNTCDRYKLEVYSKDFDQTITGETSVCPPVVFMDTLHTFQENFVLLNDPEGGEIFWKSVPEVTAYYVRYQEIIPVSEDDYEREYLFGFTSSRDNDLSEKYQNYSIGRESIWGMFPGAILEFTVEALSPELGKYLFSSLPMNDPQRTNLRDESGNPVLGFFGAAAAKTIYIIVEGEE
ncbi:MAG: DUF4249 family protein [Candidatus Marinimicrobia bacterium]|nr:DUF4249 family protein [Candidatus Neomarinimicrobiota bacterium]